MLLVGVSSEVVEPIRVPWWGRLQYDGVDAMVVLEVVDLSRKHLQWDEQVGGVGRGHWPMGSRRRRWGERYD
jgi:hypothetical protein